MASLELLLKSLKTRTTQGIVTLGLLGAISYNAHADTETAEYCVEPCDAPAEDLKETHQNDAGSSVSDAGTIQKGKKEHKNKNSVKQHNSKSNDAKNNSDAGTSYNKNELDGGIETENQLPQVDAGNYNTDGGSNVVSSADAGTSLESKIDGGFVDADQAEVNRLSIPLNKTDLILNKTNDNAVDAGNYNANQHNGGSAVIEVGYEDEENKSISVDGGSVNASSSNANQADAESNIYVTKANQEADEAYRALISAYGGSEAAVSERKAMKEAIETYKTRIAVNGNSSEASVSDTKAMIEAVEAYNARRRRSSVDTSSVAGNSNAGQLQGGSKTPLQALQDAVDNKRKNPDAGNYALCEDEPCDAPTGAGQPDGGNVLSSHNIDGGINTGSQSQSNVGTGNSDATVNGSAVNPLTNESESSYGLIGAIGGGKVSHDYALNDLKVGTAGYETNVLLVPNLKVGSDGILGLVLQYNRDSFDGFVVNGARTRDSVTNNNVRLGGVYLTGREPGRFADRKLIFGAQYLREMQNANFSGKEVNMTGSGLAAQAQLSLPQLFQLGNFNLGFDVGGDLQTRAIGSESARAREKDLGWVTNLQAGGKVILTYDDLFRLSGGYEFRREGNNESNVEASTQHYITTGLEYAGDSDWKYGIKLDIPTSNTGSGLDGKVYVRKDSVKFELVLDRNQQQTQIGPDTQRNSTFYLGGNLVIETDVVDNLVGLLTKKYRK